ncbi:MAG TPA: HNH endonuclease [Fimbriimonas sp.]|nr:HNH endonuclease [Fimbriimonas sp.]
MKLYLAVTDYDWFRQLQADRPSEVNFWLPSPDQGFKYLDAGQPFLFKLHSPRNFVVGGGYFAGYSRLPVSMAWDAFGRSNGVASKDEFLARIQHYRRNKQWVADPDIGSIILTDPFFFEESDWIPQPIDWSSNIVRGKGYDLYSGIGAELWQQVRASATERKVRESQESAFDMFGNAYLQRARLGQAAFRVLTLKNYNERCCITGENTVPVLQAAHIKPVSEDGKHGLQNGLLLRADIHILFDKGLIGVDQDYRIRVSPSIREHYLNGKVYYEHDGEELRSLPSDKKLRPDPDLLKERMDRVFVA